MTKTPRGIRNHNPGNIEYNPSTKWQGLDNPKHDGRFCRFVSPQYGIRAIARTLITYQDKRRAADGSKIDTVREIIERWAPVSENNVGAYVRSVEQVLGGSPAIDVHDWNHLRPLVVGIIRHENGCQPYTDAVIDKGLVLAGVEPPAKPLAASRTMKGAGLSGASSVAAVLSETAQQIEPLAAYADTLKWVFLALALAGICLVAYARWDDSRKALR